MRPPALGAALFLALCAAGPDGWQSYSAGHFAEAISAWSAAAAQGDPQALFGLGVAYDLGQGIGQNEHLACEYYRRAADGGIAAAAFNEAALQDGDKCGPHSAVATATWYARAAAAGHPRAMYDLAQLYENGAGVPRNSAMAAIWYRMAGDAGIAAAGAHVLAQADAAENGQLTAAIPAWPMDTAVPDRGIAVPFVWSAPSQPEAVRFYLEVYALGTKAPRQIEARYVDTSATMVVLQPGVSQYAWRVTTVAPAARRYVVSEWGRFEVRK